MVRTVNREERDSANMNSFGKNPASFEIDLRKSGIEIVNLVGSINLERELDLDELSEDMDNTEYRPQNYPSMIYRSTDSENATLLVPSSGKVAISGPRSMEDMIIGTEQLLTELRELGLGIDKTPDDVEIQNIIAQTDLEQDLNLSVVAMTIGYESLEYEPEQFPGLIYRTQNNVIANMFSSGKCILTGAKTGREIVNAREEVLHSVNEIERSKNPRS